MNGSLNGGGITRLPRRRPLRVALASQDAAAEQRLRFALMLVRVRSGLLWREVAVEALAPGDVCLRYGAGAASPPAGAHTIEVPSDPGAVAALFQEPLPSLKGARRSGPTTWALGADLPGFAWELGRPAHGQLSLRDRWQVQPILDIRRPWLDEVAELLADALLAAAAPDAELHVLPPLPGGAPWGIALSHDVDYVTTPLRYRATRAYYLARAINRGLGRAGPLIRHYAIMTVAPMDWRQRATMEAERDFGVVSEWFVFARRAGNERGTQALLYNPRYRLESPSVRGFVEDLQAAGHRVSLHASPEAGGHADLLADEKTALEAVTGQALLGVRHHLGAALYPQAPADWAAAGFTYDSTCIVNHEQGYRLGTAAPLPLTAAGDAGLLEVAPNWMDTVSFNCLGEAPERLGAEMIALADDAQARRAIAGVVWHDVPMTRSGREDRVYRDMLAHVRDEGGLIAPPGRFAEHARGLLDSRLIEDSEGVALRAGATLEATAGSCRTAASTPSFAALRDGLRGTDLPLQASAAELLPR